ncbi:hypothetical protein SAMN05444159_6114 [Bradyrhizobium lablabi]|uniref:Oligosaccharide repeat unit polymerase n=1 Tax=Bradyrhizobium lablabi TaxID=722472 RepID=A0A1M7BCY6_9BRAD|nr:hypothetical protein [Bradyrhizobium lablabi]SHL52870.1 hypothetical protein SAMN05444159_6114 [Bradyrhizobium lablabi]
MQEMSALTASYVTAAAAMVAAALYLIFRLRLFLTTTTMLVGSLLLIYGPACLSYTLSSGERAYLIHLLSGSVGAPHAIFAAIKAKGLDLGAVVTAMNFSIALMYLGIIAGVEIVDRLIPKRIAAMRIALTDWNAQTLEDDLGSQRFLLILILSLVAFMLFFSIAEHHVATIWNFLSIKGDDDLNVAKNAFRLHFAGSPNYSYRLVLGAVAPMFVIWGLLSGWVNRSLPLLLAASLLLMATAIGKLEILSKAPPAFFLIQLMIAVFLTFTNRITWRTALGGACVVALVLYAITRLIMTISQGIAGLEFVYFRVFEVENQALLENFATFPYAHPYMWGANLRPVAVLMGLPYLPAFSIVAFTWYGTYDTTNPALFIADAWADFSYAGVAVFSLIAGAVCRSVDAAFLVHGKTVVAVAVLGATFIGVFTLLATALNIALFSGGLLLAPVLAGLLVTATRYFGRQRPTSPAGNATRHK